MVSKVEFMARPSNSTTAAAITVLRIDSKRKNATEEGASASADDQHMGGVGY